MNNLFNIELEENIIGGIMRLNGVGEGVENALEELEQSDFYSTKTRHIFNVMRDIVSRKGIPDANSVSAHHLMDDTDIYTYAMDLWRNTITGASIFYWVKDLKGFSELRKIQERINSISEIMCEHSDIEEKLDRIDELFSIETGVTKQDDGFKKLSDVIPRFLEDLDNRWNNKDSIVFDTGVPAIDDIFDGGYEAGLHVIAARPKMGKTTLMTKMVNHFGVTKNLPTMVASLEMSDTQMLHHSSSALCRIDKSSIKNNFIDEPDNELALGTFLEACSRLRDSNIYISDDYDNSPKKIRRAARRIQKEKSKIGAIFIDYLGLMNADGKHDRHDLAIASMTRMLKSMSKEFKCPVILLIQLNRNLENRQDKRPIPSDSKDSGAIEQDCDSWTAIYRDSVYDENSPMGNITEIIVRLNRHGGTGTAYQLLTGKGFAEVSEEQVSMAKHRAELTKKESSKKGF